MSIYKRGKIYWYKFRFNRSLIRESTKQGNDKVARQMEAAHLVSLAKGEVGIREKKPSATLADFLKRDFLPFVEAHFAAAKPKTYDYYSYGVKMLQVTDVARLKLDEINSQHAAGFIARNSHLSASTVNCGLRTLRRSLKLAVEWGKLEKGPKITLAKGEKQRERIVTEDELRAYLDCSQQPWRDVATLLYATGMRPGEAYQLRWEHVLLNDKGGLLQVANGKSRAARRILPLVPEAYSALKVRWEGKGKPAEGWVFPSGSESGHLEESSAKNQHIAALKTLEAATSAFKKPSEGKPLHEYIADRSGLDVATVERHIAVIAAGLKRFQPYCLRHSALTRLAEAGCDAFTLARIAGHSSITITQRYCHPQAEAVERAFAKLGGHKSGHSGEIVLATRGQGELATDSR